MTNITKRFSGVAVLRNVDVELRPGEVHVLAGENGAGKSTLIKILAGVHLADDGEIRLNGRRVLFRAPQESFAAGISVIHQELSLVPSMNVVDNIFLGRERTRGFAWMRGREQQATARRFLRELGLDLDLSRPVGLYPVAVQQLIEIAKALTHDARIVIMDEPTSALTDPEVARLFEIMRELRQRGHAIVYITHKMEEIYRIGDRITVLRDGRQMGCAKTLDLPRAELVRRMVGRELSRHFPPRRYAPGPARLSVEDLSVPDPAGRKLWLAKKVSLSVRAGEILGVAGLQGSGNSAVLRGMFGVYGRIPGVRVRLDGRPFAVQSPRRSVAQGMAFLTNDRKQDGLVLSMNMTQNIGLASLPALSPRGWLRPKRERAMAAKHRDTLGIRARSLTQNVGELSGGNQQKVVLAKWLQARPRVLLLDEPTRGVDVGAKHEIYELMNRWTAAGIAILLITSEMPELQAMSDRIVVMCRGEITAEFGRGEATQDRILSAGMGETGTVSHRATEPARQGDEMGEGRTL